MLEIHDRHARGDRSKRPPHVSAGSAASDGRATCSSERGTGSGLRDRRSTVPRVNASRRALLLIRYVRLSGGEEPPDDDGQNGDDRGDHWADGRARLGRPHPDVAHMPANCVARGGV